MPSTRHITVESRSTAKTERPTNTPEKDAQIPPLVDPYIPRQAWAYIRYLLPLTAIFIFPLTFASYVFTKDGAIAPQWLASLAMSYPQAKGQVVAILATSLTATTRWALGGAAALLARKRLLRPRPVYEIDMFFSLRNISVIWDWKHRTRLFLLTWFLVFVCGLLTSGFFTLLNPLAVEVQVKHPSAREINFAATGAFDYSMEEYNKTLQSFIIIPGSLGTSNVTVGGSDIPALLRSVTRQHLASKNQSNVYSGGSFVTTLAELVYPSFIGSTSGVLITGPVVSGSPSFPEGRPGSKSPSYSLDLQGTWIDVSCSIGTVYTLNVTFVKGTGYTFTCPGSSTPRNRDGERGVGVILAFNCPMEDDTTAIYFHQSPYVYIPKLNSVNNLTCIASPRVGDVNVVLNPNFNAFNATKKRSTTLSQSSIPRNFTNLVLSNVIEIFSNIPVFLHTLEAWKAYGDDASGYDDRIFLELMPIILSTIFEFEASYMRYILTRYGLPLSQQQPEFLREVKVVLNERTIGWEVKWTTWLGLVPLTTVCAITFVMIAMAFLAEGELTAFDPMSPVSLLGAASVGNVTVPRPTSDKVAVPKQESGKTIGHPLDEEILTLNVSYVKRDGIWALWSVDGSEGSTRDL